MSVKQAFDNAATSYDRLRPLLIPCFADFYGVALSLLDYPRDAPLRVLDLGAGTGLMSMFVADELPNARLTLVDISEAMLDRARHRFDALARPADIVVADYGAGLPRDVPDWDVIVSSLSIHHLDHGSKRALFDKLPSALAPGGLFVNAEQVLGETPAIEARNVAWWKREARRLGATQAELDEADERMRHDICATVEDQLAWMRAAGLQDVACHFKHHRFAVLAGRR